MLLRPDVPLLLPDSMAILLNCFLAIGSIILALFLIDVNLFAPLTDGQMHYKIRKLACASRNAGDGVPYNWLLEEHT